MGVKNDALVNEVRGMLVACCLPGPALVNDYIISKQLINGELSHWYSYLFFYYYTQSCFGIWKGTTNSKKYEQWKEREKERLLFVMTHSIPNLENFFCS